MHQFRPWNDCTIYDFPLPADHPFIPFIHKWVDINCRDTILHEPYVVNRMVGDTSFIAGTTNSKKKEYEDHWGMSLVGTKMWSGKLGECIVHTLLHMIDGHVTLQPRIMYHSRLDVATPTRICEVKTGSWYTTGTACEKIFGSVYKYSDVPSILNIPLYIVSVAHNELFMRHHGLLSGSTPPSTPRSKLIDTCTQLDIVFYSGYKLLIDAIHMKY